MNKTFTFRDVKFNVDVFPFATGNQNIEQVPLPTFPDFASDTDEPSAEEDDPIQQDCEGIGSQQEEEMPIHHNPETSHQSLLRRSTRTVQPLVLMKDYVGCVHTEALTHVPTGVFLPPTFPYRISPSFSESYVQYLFNMSTLHEPVSYKEASQFPEWIDAMKAELDALEANKT